MLALDPFEALAIALQDPGAYALLLGSGLSRAAGIPTGWEITLELIRRLGIVRGVTDQADWAEWYRAEFGTNPSYSELLDALAATPTERRTILHGFIEAKPGDDQRRPTKAHQAVAQLVVSGTIRVIVTTNFDRLTESALREVGVEPTVISNEDGVTGALPLVHSRCTVIKVHGDYLDARILNTEAELAAYPAPIDTLLDQVFDQFGLLVVGWSGEWDIALRAALSRAPARRYSTFWATRGSPPSMAADLISHRAARTIEIAAAETFLPKLADSVAALSQSARPHPQSVAVGLALARRYCRDDSFGAEWAELLAGEAERLREYIAGPDIPTGPPTMEVVNHAISNVVDRSELLRRAVLFCARWGTKEANAQAVRVVRSLTGASRPLNGYTIWNEVTTIPASLCFYWAVAGALNREDLAVATQYMAAKVRRQYDTGTEALFQRLPLATFQDVWKFIDASTSALKASKWLEAIFEREIGDISVFIEESAELLDQTEFLIAAEWAAERLKANSTAYFWIPIGSYLHNRGRPFAERVNGLLDNATSGPLRDAGLSVSDPSMATAVGQKMTEFRGRLQIW